MEEEVLLEKHRRRTMVFLTVQALKCMKGVIHVKKSPTRQQMC